MATAKENDRMLPNESNIILKEDGKNELRISRVIQKIERLKAPIRLFVTGFVSSLIPTLFDIGSDSYLGLSFIDGDDYSKHVPHEGYHTVQFCGPSLSRTIMDDRNGSDWITVETSYHFICFEKDPIFGSITVGLIFLPGIMCMDYYYRELYHRFGLHNRRKEGLAQSCTFIFVLIGVVILCCTFPLQIIAIKFVCLLTTNRSLQKLSKEASAREGLFESSFQVCFQLYVMFSKEDRQPSQLQLVTIIISVLMIIRTSLEAFHLDQESMSFKEGAKLLPLAICGSIFKIGTISMAFAVLRFNVLYAVLIIVVVGLAAKMIKKTTKLNHMFYHFDYAMLSHAVGLKKMGPAIHVLVDEENDSDQKNSITTSRQTKNLFYSNIFWFIIYTVLLITCLVLSNMFPDRMFSSFYPLEGHEYKLSTLPIIQNFGINIIGFSIWIFGVFSLMLIYGQLGSDFTAGEFQMSFKHFFISFNSLRSLI